MSSSQNDIKKSPTKRANILLRLLGPGLVTGAANDDPSGIATYSQPERNLAMDCCGRFF
jgi:Mn2+/Fe2+ NRAMP family transporter